MNKKTCVNDEIARDFRSKVDQILKKHSGIGVKKLTINMSQYYTAKDSCYVNSWLLIAVTPGIEELTLQLSMEEYNFPCSLLSNGSGESIRYLHLCGCSFRPTAELPWLKSLTKVRLHAVCFTGDELGSLLCNSFALERLVLTHCDEMVCLKIPCMLWRLSLPNLKIANINSRNEMANTPVLRSKFLHLKKLIIRPRTTTFSYDYFSLVSLIDACPSLETLILDVSQEKMEQVSIFTDPSDLRKGQQHHKMKRVKILGFTSAKSLVELTCHFLESVTSLEYLTLESYQSIPRCSMRANKCRKCFPLPIDVLREAQRGLLAIRTYIEPKVPSMVKLRVVEPCRRCHAAVEL
ncbi:hypothetical protein HU200_027717 [Digitaria exilis]|uniref:At1g61320/AtMIF1 LRR domain-containing protein n=1 Tax=Digitaria exilis TaxID=1010633 RepID=A0A835BWY9_9POAL|nr:hypothetical protein HU200_027717 [Digitaria exilis]